jgi:hypothetical protein
MICFSLKCRGCRRGRDNARWTLPATTPNYAKRHSATWTDSPPYEGRARFRRSRGRLRVRRRPHSVDQPAARDLQASAMEHLLSIRTVFPRRGGRVWYDDQLDAHRQIYAGDDVIDYAFMGTDPNSPDNRCSWMRCSSRSRSSISSVRRRVDISQSSRHLS